MVEAILDPIGARVVERACSSTQAVLARVSEMDLDRPTPCASWTVTGVIRHVVGGAAYFAELAEAGDPGRRQELATKYGVTYSSDWVADLTSRYNLKLLGQ